DMRVGIERDIGETILAADKELVTPEMLLHDTERGVALLHAPRQLHLLQGAQLGQKMLPEAYRRDERLVAVLLEEHPLQRLGPRSAVRGRQPGGFRQGTDDGVR